MRWLLSALVFSAFAGLSGCDAEDDPFHAAPGGTSGSHAGSEGAGEGGSAGDTATRDSLTIAANVRTWANAASAVGVYVDVYQLFAVADGHDEGFSDPNCPSSEDDGTTLTFTGDCTDDQGAAWVGEASVERGAGGDMTLTLNGFGTHDGDTIDVKNGDAEIRRVDAENHDFEVRLVHARDVTETIEYTGHVRGDYERSVWSGSGTVTREGLAAPLGTIEATTTDEVVDASICSGQPVSGNTVLENEAGESVTVTYDGSVECDDDQAASFSLNGEPQGKITGIACSMGRASGSDGLFALLALCFASGGLRLRRRAPRRARFRAS